MSYLPLQLSPSLGSAHANAEKLKICRETARLGNNEMAQVWEVGAIKKNFLEVN